MTKDFLDLIIEKVQKPKIGWTLSFLEKYNFDFSKNKTIKDNIEIVLKILNDNLPYFYYCVPIDKILYTTKINSSLTKKWIIIDTDYLLNIKNISKKTIKTDGVKFSKSILEYKSFLTNIHYEKIDEYLNTVDKKLKKEQQKTDKSKNHKFTTTITPISKKNKYNKGGIYGIFSVNQDNIKKLLYVGLTTRDFETRWDEHKKILYNQAPVPNGMYKLYKLLKDEFEYNTLIAEPIIIFSELNINRPLTQGEKEAMELAIITSLKPLGNTSGVDVPYYFTDEKSEFPSLIL